LHRTLDYFTVSFSGRTYTYFHITFMDQSLVQPAVISTYVGRPCVVLHGVLLGNHLLLNCRSLFCFALLPSLMLINSVIMNIFLLQIYLLAAQPSKLVTIIYRLQLNFLNGAVLACAFPWTETRLVSAMFEYKESNHIFGNSPKQWKERFWSCLINLTI